MGANYGSVRIWGEGAMSGVPVKPSTDQGCLWALGIAAFIGLLLALGKCTTTTGNSSAAAPLNSVSDTIANSISAQDPPPVKPLSPTNVTKGIAHYRLAFKAEGLSGAMIYSQNCYDAVARTFSWAKLDSCGAFDMMTIRSMSEDEQPELQKEVAYFDAETAAGRYLKALTGAGQAADEADKRLTNLQARIDRIPLPKPTPIAETPVCDRPDSPEKQALMNEIGTDCMGE